jgi:hypothetical protein
VIQLAAIERPQRHWRGMMDPHSRATFGEFTYPQAGMITQIIVTIILIAVFFMPSAGRIRNPLNVRTRNFRLSMEDVAQAYRCHTADRSGIFAGSEVTLCANALRYLRDHPDAGSADLQVLEIAAQMSHQSCELADIYNVWKKSPMQEMFLHQRANRGRASAAADVEAHRPARYHNGPQRVELEEASRPSSANFQEQLDATLPPLATH